MIPTILLLALLSISGSPVTITNSQNFNLPATGAASITLHGSNFIFRIDIARLGGTRSPFSTWISSSHIALKLPSSIVGRKLDIAISSLGLTVSSFTSFFSVDRVFLISTSSSNQPTTAALSISVLGKSLGVRGETCRGRFGGSQCVASLWTSDSAVGCKLAGLGSRVGQQLLIFSLEQQTGTGDRFSVVSYDQSGLLNVNRAFSVISTGGSSMTISGSGFRISDPTMLGRASGTPAETSFWKSDSSLACKAPNFVPLLIPIFSLTLASLKNTIQAAALYDSHKITNVVAASLAVPTTGALSLTLIGSGFGQQDPSPRVVIVSGAQIVNARATNWQASSSVRVKSSSASTAGSGTLFVSIRAVGGVGLPQRVSPPSVSNPSVVNIFSRLLDGRDATVDGSGGVVQIDGTGFIEADSSAVVKIDASPCVGGVRWVSDSTIKCRTQIELGTSNTVSVTTAGRSGSLVASHTFRPWSRATIRLDGLPSGSGSLTSKMLLALRTNLATTMGIPISQLTVTHIDGIPSNDAFTTITTVLPSTLATRPTSPILSILASSPTTGQTDGRSVDLDFLLQSGLTILVSTGFQYQSDSITPTISVSVSIVFNPRDSGGSWLEDVSPAASPPNCLASDITGIVTNQSIAAGETQVVNVAPRDVIGRLTEMPSSWNLVISDGNTTSFAATQSLSLGFGPTLVYFAVTRAGFYTVALTFSPQVSPSQIIFSISVTASSTSSATASKLDLPASGTVRAGQSSTAVVRAYDAYGNAKTVGGESLVVQIDGPRMVLATVTDLTNGTYLATFTPELSGSHILNAWLNGRVVTGTAPTFTVLSSSICASLSSVSSTYLSTLTAGVTSVIYVAAYDQFGSRKPESVEIVLGQIEGISVSFQTQFSSVLLPSPCVLDTNTVLYKCSILATTTGNYSVAIVLASTAQPIHSSPFAISVRSGFVNVSASSFAPLYGSSDVYAGNSLQISIPAWDVYGNRADWLPVSDFRVLEGAVGNLVDVAYSVDNTGSLYPDFSAIVIRPTVAGMRMLDVRVAGKSLFTSSSLFTVLPSTVSAIKSIFSVSTSFLAAGVSYQMSFVAKDKFENVLLATSPPPLTIAQITLLRQPNNTLDSGARKDLTITANMQPVAFSLTLSGFWLVTATIGTETLVNAPLSLLVVAGSPDPTKSIAEGPGRYGTSVNVESPLRLSLRDAFNNPVRLLDGLVGITGVDCTNGRISTVCFKSLVFSIVSTGGLTHSTSWISYLTGRIQVSVAVPGGHIIGSPFEVTVVDTPGIISSSATGLEGYGLNDPVVVVAGEVLDVRVAARDASGVQLRIGGDAITATVKEGLRPLSVFDLGTGFYRISTFGNTTGTYSLWILSSLTHIGNSPYPLTVKAAPTDIPSTSARILSSPVNTLTAGVSATMAIYARDKYGNLQDYDTLGIIVEPFKLYSDPGGTRQYVGKAVTPISKVDNNNAEISFFLTFSGNYSISLTLANATVATYNVATYPGPAYTFYIGGAGTYFGNALLQIGQSVNLTISPIDAYGNAVKVRCCKISDMVYAIGDPSAAVSSTVQAVNSAFIVGPHTWQSTFRAQKIGIYPLGVFQASIGDFGTPTTAYFQSYGYNSVSVTVSGGAPVSIDVSGDGSGQSTVGNVATFTILSRDSAGNAVADPSLWVVLKGPQCSLVLPNLQRPSEGKTVASYFLTRSGSYSIQINRGAVTVAAPSLTIVPDSSTGTFVASPVTSEDYLGTATVGVPSTFSISCLDKYGNAFSSGCGALSVVIVELPLASAITLSTAIAGVASAVWTPVLIQGLYTLRVVSSVSSANTPTPVARVRVVPGAPAASKSLLGISTVLSNNNSTLLSGSVSIGAGSPFRTMIQLRDLGSNPTTSSALLGITIADSLGVVIRNCSGNLVRYPSSSERCCDFVITKSALYTVTAFLDLSLPSASASFLQTRITVWPSIAVAELCALTGNGVSGTTAGVTSTVYISCLDLFGNVGARSSNIQVILIPRTTSSSRPSAQRVSTFVEQGNGYLGLYWITVSGKYDLSVKVESRAVPLPSGKRDGLITVSPADAAAFTSGLSVDGIEAPFPFANATTLATTVFSVTGRDQYGNSVPSSNWQSSLSISVSPSTSGTLQSSVTGSGLSLSSLVFTIDPGQEGVFSAVIRIAGLDVKGSPLTVTRVGVSKIIGTWDTAEFIIFGPALLPPVGKNASHIANTTAGTQTFLNFIPRDSAGNSLHFGPDASQISVSQTGPTTATTSVNLVALPGQIQVSILATVSGTYSFSFSTSIGGAGGRTLIAGSLTLNLQPAAATTLAVAGNTAAGSSYSGIAGAAVSIPLAVSDAYGNLREGENNNGTSSVQVVFVSYPTAVAPSHKDSTTSFNPRNGVTNLAIWLTVSGLYRVSITVNGATVSPVQLQVSNGDPSIVTSSISWLPKPGGDQIVYVSPGDTITATVFARDSWGNNCSAAVGLGIGFFATLQTSNRSVSMPLKQQDSQPYLHIASVMLTISAIYYTSVSLVNVFTDVTSTSQLGAPLPLFVNVSWSGPLPTGLLSPTLSSVSFKSTWVATSAVTCCVTRRDRFGNIVSSSPQNFTATQISPAGTVSSCVPAFVGAAGPDGLICCDLLSLSKAATAITIRLTDGGEHFAGSPFTISVIDATSPRLVSALLPPRSPILSLFFSARTDRGGVVGHVQCQGLLTTDTLALLGTSPSCRWFDALRLDVRLGAGATISQGQRVTLASGWLKGESQMTVFARDTIAVVGSVLPPVLSVSAPASVGVCSRLIFDGGFSGGARGQLPTVTWIAGVLGGNFVQIQAAVDITNARKSSDSKWAALFVDGILPTKALFKLQVSSLPIGGSVAIPFTVLVSTLPGPSVVIVGGSSRTFTRASNFVFETITNLPTRTATGNTSADFDCSSLSGNFIAMFSWTGDGDHLGSPLPIVEGTESSAVVTIDATKLVVGANYIAIVTVSLVSSTDLATVVPGTAAATASVTFHVARQPIALSILGGSRSVASNRTLSLTLSTASDRDYPDSPLSFFWNCSTLSVGVSCPNSCFGNSNNLSVPGILSPGIYTFTVVAISMVDSAFATDLVDITVTSVEDLNEIIIGPESLYYLGVPAIAGEAVTASVGPHSLFASPSSSSSAASTGLCLAGTSSATAVTASTISSVSVVNGDVSVKDNVAKIGNTFFVISPTGVLEGQNLRIRFFSQPSASSQTSGFADFQLTFPPAPFGGVCSSTPTEGYSSQTLFSLQCSGWIDSPENLPLSYEWSYDLLSPETGTASLLGVSLQRVRPEVFLPFGKEINDYALNMKACVVGQVENFVCTDVDPLVLPPLPDQVSAANIVSTAAGLVAAGKPVEAASYIANSIQARTKNSLAVLPRVTAMTLLSYLGVAAKVGSGSGKTEAVTLRALWILIDAVEKPLDSTALETIFQIVTRLFHSVDNSGVADGTLSAMARAQRALASAIFSAQSAVASSKTSSPLDQRRLSTVSIGLLDLFEKVVTLGLGSSLLDGPSTIVSTLAPGISWNSTRVERSRLPGRSFSLGSVFFGFPSDCAVVFLARSYFDVTLARFLNEPHLSASNVSALVAASPMYCLKITADSNPTEIHLRTVAPLSIVIPAAEINANILGNNADVLMFWNESEGRYSKLGCIALGRTANPELYTAACYHFSDYVIFARSEGSMFSMRTDTIARSILTKQSTKVAMMTILFSLLGAFIFFVGVSLLVDTRQKRIFKIDPMGYIGLNTKFPKRKENFARQDLSTNFGYNLRHHFRQSVSLLEYIDTVPYALLTRVQIFCVLAVIFAVDGAIVSVWFNFDLSVDRWNAVVVGLICGGITLPVSSVIRVLFVNVNNRTYQKVMTPAELHSLQQRRLKSLFTLYNTSIVPIPIAIQNRPDINLRAERGPEALDQVGDIVRSGLARVTLHDHFHPKNDGFFRRIFRRISHPDHYHGVRAETDGQAPAPRQDRRRSDVVRNTFTNYATVLKGEKKRKIAHDDMKPVTYDSLADVVVAITAAKMAAANWRRYTRKKVERNNELRAFGIKRQYISLKREARSAFMSFASSVNRFFFKRSVIPSQVRTYERNYFQRQKHETRLPSAALFQVYLIVSGVLAICGYIIYLYAGYYDQILIVVWFIATTVAFTLRVIVYEPVIGILTTVALTFLENRAHNNKVQRIRQTLRNSRRAKEMFQLHPEAALTTRTPAILADLTYPSPSPDRRTMTPMSNIRGFYPEPAWMTTTHGCVVIPNVQQYGVLYYLGVCGGTHLYRNPAIHGEVRVMNSDPLDRLETGDGATLAGRDRVELSTGDWENSWLSIDLGAKVRLRPSAYTLWHGHRYATRFPRNWVLQARDESDPDEWIDLRRHIDDDSIKEVHGSATWQIVMPRYLPPETSFRVFRIRQFGLNSSNTHHFSLSGIEFFGTLRADYSWFNVDIGPLVAPVILPHEFNLGDSTPARGRKTPTSHSKGKKKSPPPFPSDLDSTRSSLPPPFSFVDVPAALHAPRSASNLLPPLPPPPPPPLSTLVTDILPPPPPRHGFDDDADFDEFYPSPVPPPPFGSIRASPVPFAPSITSPSSASLRYRSK